VEGIVCLLAQVSLGFPESRFCSLCFRIFFFIHAGAIITLLLLTTEMQRVWLAEKLTPSLCWKNELEGVNAPHVEGGKP